MNRDFSPSVSRIQKFNSATVTACHQTQSWTTSIQFLLLGCKLFQKSRSHSKILDITRVTRCQFNTGNPQILRNTVGNLVSSLTWYARFVCTCPVLNIDSLKTTILLPYLTFCLPAWLCSRGFPTKLYYLHCCTMHVVSISSLLFQLIHFTTL
jgi:hypothetical protein